VDWWSKNDDGVWCNVCGNCLKASFNFDSEDDFAAYEPTDCRQCSAPDEIDPEAI